MLPSGSSSRLSALPTGETRPARSARASISGDYIRIVPKALAAHAQNGRFTASEAGE